MWGRSLAGMGLTVPPEMNLHVVKRFGATREEIVK